MIEQLLCWWYYTEERTTSLRISLAQVKYAPLRGLLSAILVNLYKYETMKEGRHERNE